MGSEKTQNTLIKKLREQQESQRQLVEAIDGIEVERKRLQWTRVKYLIVVLIFCGGLWALFDSFSMSAIFAEMNIALKNLIYGNTYKAAAPPPLEEKRFLPPSPRQQEVAAIEWVKVIPTEITEEPRLRSAPAAVAEAYASGFVANEAPIPLPISYRSWNQLPQEIQELDNAPKQGYENTN
jgi:hypothetical protein